MNYNNLFNYIIKSIKNQRTYEIIMQYCPSSKVVMNHNLTNIPVKVNNSFLFPCINLSQSY